MGLFDSLFGGKRCPVCDTKGAKITDIQVRCPNPACQYFDPSLQKGGGRPKFRGDFRPANPIAIRYRNFHDQEAEFSAERGSLVRKENHIVAQVAPTGMRISLSRDRIQNLIEVEQTMDLPVEQGQDWPTPRERQVLGYHKRHGTTSALYAAARAKYPKW